MSAWRSVGGSARLEPMDRVSNPLWRVIAEDGREWVLKHLAEIPPGAGPVDEYRVSCYLQAAGLPVAVPVVTDDGMIIFNAENLRADMVEEQPTGTHAYALLPLFPNDSELREEPQLAHTIGAGIGRLDRALADCPWHVRSFTDDPAPQILTQRYPGLPEELRELTTPLRDRLYAAIVDLPTQRTHGDCNSGNVLVHNGAVTGYIDLDHLPIGPRVRDLSYYLVSRFIEHVDHGNPDSLALVLRHYVSGYHSEHPLTGRELAAVVPMMLTVAIGGADWCLHGSVPDPAAYQRDLRTIQWFIRHYDEFTSTAVP